MIVVPCLVRPVPRLAPHCRYSAVPLLILHVGRNGHCRHCARLLVVAEGLQLIGLGSQGPHVHPWQSPKKNNLLACVLWGKASTSGQLLSCVRGILGRILHQIQDQRRGFFRNRKTTK